MKRSIYLLGKEVAVLESVGDFKSVVTYLAAAGPADFISLTMPVRTESYTWEDQLPPVLQMNLPEGYLLQVLQEEFGPQIGASPIALLSVIGRNMVGRLQVAAPGAVLSEPPSPIEVAQLLHGDNSEEAFAELVRTHAASGVSGVLPKFLDTLTGPGSDVKPRTAQLGPHNKATLLTGRHIIKGSSGRLPYAALNEFLCMQVVAKVLPCARTEVSQDGNALVVHRFDVDESGHPLYGMEDLCSLLGLRPAAKYETTWERIAKAARDHVPGSHQYETFRRLAATLLLTYALRNADCHAKNLALLYTSWEDVHLSPTYDFLTTSVYAGYQHNPPAISFMGKKTWMPGKTLPAFITGRFGIPLREQTAIVESIGDAVSDAIPLVQAKMSDHSGFKDIGKRMLLAWGEGVKGLRDKRIYAVGDWQGAEALAGISDPPPLVRQSTAIGRSELLGGPSKNSHR